MSKKLALIAVCNKLLKQAFAIVKSRLPYDANYKSAFELKKYKMHLFFTSVLLSNIFLTRFFKINDNFLKKMNPFLMIYTQC